MFVFTGCDGETEGSKEGEHEAVYLPNEDSIDFAETILDIILGLAIVIGGTGFGMYLVHFHKEWSDTANKRTGPSIVAMLIIAVVGKRALGSLK